MEEIKRAVERAKASANSEQLRPMTTLHGQTAPHLADTQEPESVAVAPQGSSTRGYNHVTLDWSHLEQRRIVGHNVADPRSKAFDVLRTQVLQAMDQKNWRFLAITSPTEG